MTAVQGVVFDLDGVLSDTEVVCYRGLQAMLAPAVLTWEDYATQIGHSTDVTVAWLRERFQRPESLEELSRLTSEAIYRLLEQSDLEPMPGARRVVEAVAARGLRLGVASQSSPRWVERTLRSIGLRHHVEAIVTAFEVPRGKPAPDVYLAAAERLGIDPARAIAVEDSLPGLEAALAAGMQVVQLRAAPEAPPPHPQVAAVLTSLEEFDLAWLERGAGAR